MSSSHDCIWGVCNTQQYCCGDNVCCDETDVNSLILTATILGTIIVMALCCACFYCTSRRIYAPFLKRYLRVSYTFISARQENKTNTGTNEESATTGCTV